jgi:drug/metabolite transporter (DMT)-like permease
MKKLINLGLFLSFFLCYLEWGGGQSIFIAQTAYELIFAQGLSWNTAFHPVILSAIVGLLILLYAAIVRKPNRWVNILGVVLLSAVVFIFFLAGALSGNLRMIGSNLPFLVLAGVFFVLGYRERKAQA